MAEKSELTKGEDHILEVLDLKTYFYSDDSVAKAVDGVNLRVGRRSTLGIVGESGSGKSITSLSVMGLIPQPPGKIVSGQILFEGTDLLRLSEREMRKIRGNKISMIFQEPMTSLNPVYTVGDQIAEVFRLHRGMKRKEALQESVRMLELVRIPSPAQRVHNYPHQMSGGMRQRVMIAMALACNPDLLIADEPTTALDVTVQAQILDLMADLKESYGSSIMLITHDLGVVAEISDEVAVMYAGQRVEYAPTDNLFEKPLHPYTMGLLDSRPKLSDADTRAPLTPILGNVPNPTSHPPGCRFAPRCPYATERCNVEQPVMHQWKPRHWARCHYVNEIETGTQIKHDVAARFAG